MSLPTETFFTKHTDLIHSGLIFCAGIVLLGGAAFVALAAFKTPMTEQTAAVAAVVPPPNAFANIHLTGHAAIVYDLSTGETLYAQDADRPLPLASLTKLLTLYAAVGVLQDQSPVTITPTALAQDGEYGFTEGETFTFRDIARLALIASSNDAAAAIAEAAASSKHVSGTQLMASAAANAGLTHTSAQNGTGLDLNTQEAGAYGTARDIAILASKLLEKSPDIAESTIASSITIRSTTGTVHTLPNTNQDVVRVPGILLSKTGFTDIAGGNLVVVYDAAIGHPVAVVVLGSTREGRFSDVADLIEATGAHFAGVATSS